MDSNSSNPSVPPSQVGDPGATRYFPPQGGPDQQGAAPSVQQAPYGQQAQSVPPPYPSGGQTPYSYPASFDSKRQRDRTMLGLILIGGGVLFLLGQFSFFPGFGDMVLLLIGGIFMYAYFTTRPGYRIGFLIPGAILLGIGAGQVLENLPFSRVWGGEDISALTLGLGFCLIWFLQRRHWWALIPGGILVLAGLSSSFLIGRLWPVLLIGLGVYLLYDHSRRHAH